MALAKSPIHSRALWLSLALIGSLAFSFGSSVNATTIVPPGLVPPGTVWTTTGSPYCVTGDIQVSLLSIQPGVEVLIDGPFEIEVLTTISSQGENGNEVRFAPLPPTQNWRGILFDTTPPGSEFVYTVFEGASNSAVSLVDCVAPLFEGCLFMNNSSTGSGGAIFAQNVAGDLSVVNCHFEGNAAAVNGGALQSDLSSGSLLCTGCTFIGNVANPGYQVGNRVGGAMRILSGDAEVTQCVFEDNRSNSRCSASFECDVTARGGALYIDTPGLVDIENCLLRGNITDARNGGGSCAFGGSRLSYGAGVYVQSGEVALRNCIIACGEAVVSGLGCMTVRRGSGIFVNGGNVQIEYCTVARNDNATGIYQSGGSVTMNSSILFFNNGTGVELEGTIAADYCNIQEPVGYPGLNNLNFNPAFAGTGCSCDDLRITLGSPSMDSGDPLLGLDVCFPPSIGSDAPDQGAHGGALGCDWSFLSCLPLSPNFIRGDVNGDGIVDIGDPVSALSALFGGGPPVQCEDSSDANDDGAFDVSDSVFSLTSQFSGGPSPSSPFPDCGVDPTPDPLVCIASPCP